MVQWLRLHATNAEGAGSIPGQGTKIPHAMWHGQKKKKTLKMSLRIELKGSSCEYKNFLNDVLGK